MNAIQIMMDEHVYIKKALQIIRALCLKILYEGKVDTESFYQVIDFIRNYADKYHHGKEEDFLFKMMSEELGEVIQKGPIAGMLAEHDLGRLYVSNLKAALEQYENHHNDAKIDIIGNAIAYEELLQRHITKEDTAIYTFAEKKLSSSTLDQLNQFVDDFESSEEKTAIRNQYLAILQELEAKYL